MRTFLLMRYDNPSAPSFLDVEVAAEGVIFTEKVVLYHLHDESITIYDSVDVLKGTWVDDGTHFIQFKEGIPLHAVERHFTLAEQQEIVQIVEKHLRQQLRLRGNTLMK